MSVDGGDIVADLFVDETGKFSEPDQMRLVGGLLVVGSTPAASAIQQIHANAARIIGWPVRLHGLELSRFGFMLLWYACGGLAQASSFLPANTDPQLAEVLRDHPLPSSLELVTTNRWTRAAVSFAKSIESLLRRHRRAASIGAIGRQLRAMVLEHIAVEFRAWCTRSRAAYMIAGHVDDSEPAGMTAYIKALTAALQVAGATAAAMGARKLRVVIADPHLGSPLEIVKAAASISSVEVGATIVEYDDGGPGLWLADALLSWCRPLPGAWPTPLDIDCDAAKCLVAATTSIRDHRSLDTYAKFLAATRIAATRMTK